MEIEGVNKVIIVMGVSGSGKSSIGQLLAEELFIPFIDADDYHPKSNVEKMSQGIPLNDTDRIPWLNALNLVAIDNVHNGCVIACSALKKDYRSRLGQSIESNILKVYLKGSFDVIYDRMQNRKEHFMGAEMLKSQYDTLEEPEDALVISIVDTPQVIIQKIKSYI